ncbi:MAG: YbfB/YjiJ family MFS transporter [Pontibacterium sp.]
MHIFSERTKVYLSGILLLIISVGVARFAYTPILPIMQAQTWLDDAAGGWLAAINYMGYFSGALIATTLTSPRWKYLFCKVAIVFAVLTTWMMAYTESMVIWSISRFIAGMCGAAGMVVVAGLILNWLLRHNYRPELGVHFMGVGLGIAIIALAMAGFLAMGMDWASLWTAFTVLTLVLCVPAWRWLPAPEGGLAPSANAMADNPPSTKFFWLMMLAYFCAGYGYVIDATFIVDIVEQQPALSGQGPLVFLILGLAAMPATVIWDRVARKTGYLKALLLAYWVQVVGIVLPVFTDSLLGVIVAALLFGGTFIGCVSLVLTMAGRFYPNQPAKLMAKMTLAYGAAQFVAPALTGMLAEAFGNYDLGLLIAAGFVVFGSVILLWLIRLQKFEKARL